MSEDSFIERLRTNSLFKSFLFYSAFRAVYGFGILLVAYFFATSTEAPWWATTLIFIASMIFSRILFRFIKKFTGKEEENPLP
jgi:biotin transporter BioY